MTLRLPRILLTGLAAAGLAGAAAPAARAADRTVCVNVPACPAGAVDFGNLTLGSVLGLAGANPGRDHILLGYNGGTPYTGPVVYSAGGADNTLELEGVGGRPVITSSTPGKPVLSLTTGEPRLEHLEVVVPTLPDADGIDADRASLDDVRVHGVGDGSLQTAVKLTGSTAIF